MADRPTYKDLQARWERVRAAENDAYRKEPAARLARGPETAATLSAMYEATNNPAYAEAFKAMQEDGFGEGGSSWKWTPLREKNADAVYLDRMHWLIERQRHSLRHAAALVAVDFFIPGKTFNAVVKQLETAYRKAEREV